MITRPNVHGSHAANSRRKKSYPVEHYQLFNFDRYKWCRLAKCKKLKDFLYQLHKFFGVISKDNHLPVIFIHAENIIRKLNISMRTFRSRMKKAIDAGFFISTKGKAGRSIYVAKYPDQKNIVDILKNAIEKCREHKTTWIIKYLKKTKTAALELEAQKHKVEIKNLHSDFEKLHSDSHFLHSDFEHSILDTNSCTNLGTGTLTETEEPSIEHPENLDPTFTQDLEKVFKSSKTKISNPIIQELVKIWAVYRPAETIEHLKTKIERFNEGRWYPNKVIQMLRDDGLTWHLKDRSRYKSECFGVHDAASIGLNKSTSYWKALEEKQKPKEIQPPPVRPPKPSKELESKWDTILIKLKENLAPHSFASWFETETIPLKIHANETILMLHDEFCVEHVTKKYLGFLQWIFGNDNVRLMTYDDGHMYNSNLLE